MIYYKVLPTTTKVDTALNLGVVFDVCGLLPVTVIIKFFDREIDMDDMTYAYVLLIGCTVGALLISVVGHLIGRD